jgi:FkbM family methyltransferase
MTATEISGQELSAFDDREYIRLINSRGDFIWQTVQRLKPALALNTALDTGAGIGFFVSILEKAGLQTHAFEGRSENVEEARKRYAGIQIQVGDVEDPGIAGLGIFDFVLCFGLLYHLENPFRAVRNLKALTGKALLLESMCIPDMEPWAILREEPKQEDQSLTDVALYSSEGLIVKMLYRAGFSHVYCFDKLPDHEQFCESLERKRRRTVLLATYDPVTLPGVRLLREPAAAGDPWQKQNSVSTRIAVLMKKFLAKTPRGRYAGIAKRWLQKFPKSGVPLRLPFGAWWIARRGRVDERLLEGNFEISEIGFVEKFLRTGMTVLDIGAHHGLYTLLASKRVGQAGKVFAFEPSPRERRLLEQHLRLNFCSNVRVQSVALGVSTTTTDLFLVDGEENGCNSLRPPTVDGKTTPVKVQVVSLDEWLEEHGNPAVDFIKLDVEGGELDVLKGAMKMLSRVPRPVIFAEIQDIRTRSWGYSAREITLELRSRGYHLFQIAEDGRLGEMKPDLQQYDGNYIAFPEERLATIGTHSTVVDRP